MRTCRSTKPESSKTKGPTHNLCLNYKRYSEVEHQDGLVAAHIAELELRLCKKQKSVDYSGDH